MKKKPKRSLKDTYGSSREFLKYSNVAFRMIAIILIGVFAGIKLDEYFELETSIFTLVLTLFSVAASMVVVIREISKDK